MKQNKIDYFMRVATETAKLSTCVSKQVGAVLVRDNRIIAIGYNGVPSQRTHCNQIFDSKDFDRDKHHEWSLYNELHAEQNIISYCAKNGISIDNSILFVTLSPCINCAKLLLTSGVRMIYYLDIYDKENGLDFLHRNKVICIKYNENETV